MSSETRGQMTLACADLRVEVRQGIEAPDMGSSEH